MTLISYNHYIIGGQAKITNTANLLYRGRTQNRPLS